MIPGDFKPRSKSRAIEDMAQLVSSELKLDITPDAIRGLFERRWATLSTLAHAIHEGVDPPASAADSFNADSLKQPAT